MAWQEDAWKFANDAVVTFTRARAPPPTLLRYDTWLDVMLTSVSVAEGLLVIEMAPPDWMAAQPVKADELIRREGGG